MGVRGLQSYLESYCKSAIPIKSIEELADKRREYAGQELIIIADGFNCIQHLYADLPWIGGAVLKEYVQNAEVFVKAFRHIGIRLVFFFDGPTVLKKRKTWVERRMETMEKVNHILDVIDQGALSDSVSKHDYFILPPGIYQQTKHMLRTLNCEVQPTVNECDEEIALFARNEDAFGVLGHDTDFVILDIGRAFYLDTDHLDLQTMRTRVYYRQELGCSLGLTEAQLPLLATLMGNDFVRFNDLKSFHYKLMSGKGRNLKFLVPNIASYIQSLPDDFLQPDVLTGVAKHVFNNTFRAADIADSVVSYGTLESSKGGCHSRGQEQGGRWRGTERHHGSQRSRGSGRREERGGGSWGSSWRDGNRSENRTNCNWREKASQNWREDSRREKEDRAWLELVSEVRRLYRNNEVTDTVYAVISGLPFDSSTSIEDYRIVPRDLPIFAELTKDLRQRLYGILFQQKPMRPGSHEVEEWCMAGPGSLDGACHNAAVAPSTRHPGLLVLWSDKDRPQGRMNDIRWTLLVHSVSPHLDVKSVQMLPPHLVMPTLILYHIVHYEGPGRLEEWEADVVLATASVIHRYGPCELSTISQDRMTSRSVRVSDLVMTTSELFYDLIAACGNPLSDRQTAPWNFFDSKLFQSKYREAQQTGVTHAQLCDYREDSLDVFLQARSVIFDKSENYSALC